MKKWNELSMADRAKYIKLGVEQGITDINHISSAYNSYADGGTLPELVVTPRMNYTHYTGDEYIAPTLNEYKDARRNEIRANALLAMQNDKEPYVPSVPNKLGRAFRTVAGDWFDDDDVMFIFGKDNNPSTCISTVSSKYGRMIPGNKTFYDRSEDLGFIRIPEDERDHGDIVQTVGKRGVPSHAAMISGFTRDGRMLIDESHGGKTSETIEHDIDYFDTNPNLKNKLYYRFIGNDDDNRRWETEYNSLFPTKANRFDTGGPKPSAMERIASIIASDPRFANVNVDAALANYEDSVRERNAVQLPEFTVTATKKKKERKGTEPRISTQNKIFQYTQENRQLLNQVIADKINEQKANKLANISSQNLKVRRNLEEADARTNAQTFTGKNVLEDIATPIMNLYMPSQWIGAAFDAAQGERGFWEALGRGNSGFVSDKFAEEHPYWSMAINLVGDGGIYGARNIVNDVKKIYNSNTNLGSYLRNPNIGDYSLGVPLYKDKYYRVVTGRSAIDDANKSGLIRARTGMYNGELERIWRDYKDVLVENGYDTKEKVLAKWMDDYNAGQFDDVIGDIIEEEAIRRNPRKTLFADLARPRASTNHGGTVGFRKGNLYYDLADKDIVIEGNNNSATFARGHHGKVNKTIINENVKPGENVVLLENGTNKNATAPASGFRYYEPTKHSLAGRTIYRRRKFNNK